MLNNDNQNNLKVVIDKKQNYPTHNCGKDTSIDNKIFNRKFLKNIQYNILEGNKNVSFKQLTFVSDKKELKKLKKEIKKSKIAKKKKSFKKRALNGFLFSLCAIITGVGLGTWYYKNVLSSSLDWGTYLKQLSQYEATEQTTLDAGLKKILGSSYSEEDKMSFETVAKEKGLTPLDFTLAENYQLANYNFKTAPQYMIQGRGSVKTIATQNIYSEKKFDGTTYQAISISNGIMQIAEIAQMNKSQTGVTTIKGSITSNEEAIWNGARNNYLPSEYKTLTGGLPNTSQNFIVSNDTVLNNTTAQIEVIENEDGSKYYQFTMELDNIYSVLNYIRQIKYTSNLSAYPEFTSITQVVTIDENWNFVSISSTEVYSMVAFGMKNYCTGTLENMFYFDKEITVEIL